MDLLLLILLGFGLLFMMFDLGPADAADETPDPVPETGFFLDLDGETPVIMGTDGDDLIENDDILALRALADVTGMHALDGDDTIIADRGALGGMTLHAGPGDDLIVSHSATTATIFGDEGNDTITASNAVVHGGPGDDVIEMSPGSLESPQTAIAHGGPGNDLLTAPDGYAELRGGEGNDTLVGGTGSQLYGDEGDDDLTIFGNFAVARGGDGNDLMRARVRIEPLEIADTPDARWNPFDSGLVLFGGSGGDDFVVEIDPQVELDAARTEPVVMATIGDFTPGTDALLVHVAYTSLPFGSTLMFAPLPDGPTGALLTSDAPTVMTGLSFAGVVEAPGGTHTDLVFTTGPDTHDLVVRLAGVSGLDPALVVASADLQSVEITL